ncbi:MAG: hypothetical protein KGL39_50175 [Patescibacteria group bacterium]|nr:hypothetical protein [Patescibacteria group bacterium]
MPLKQIKGIGTIVWGTAGVLGGSIPAGSIVQSIRLTPKNAAPIEIEDNDGITAFQILLRDGFNAKASVLYDASKSYPVEGANATLALNWNGALANAVPFGEPGTNGGTATVANGVATYTTLIVGVSPGFEKKKEMMVDIDLTYRPNVAV